MTPQPQIVAAILECLGNAEDGDLCIELDELVHDIAAEDESIPLGAVDEGDAEQVSDRRSGWASDKNNEGAEAQLLYILGSGSISEALEILDTFARSAHERLKVREVLAEAGLW